MRIKSVGLLNDVVGTYDKTKTSVFGRMTKIPFDSKYAISAPDNKFIDYVTDSGITVTGISTYTDNDRLFIVGLATGAILQVVLYNFNHTTGVYEYVGKVHAQLPNQAATTHTIRGIRVVDTGTTGWKVFVLTSGSVLINGGLFLLNNLALSDFVQVGFPTLTFANGSNQKALYLCQDSAAMGVAANITVGVGLSKYTTANRIYVHNGTAAVHQYFVFDYTATPDVANQQVCTTPIASPGVVNTTNPHGLVAGDHVLFTTTGALPTGLLPNVVYFVIAAGLTPTTFQVSLTTGGAAINFTGTQSGIHTMMRGFGETSSLFVHKTGNLTVLAGTLLATDSENVVVPGHTILIGQDCIFLCTTTAMYLGKISELTAGATAWPSLITANVLGPPNEVTAITLTQANWSDSLDAAVFTAGSIGFVKKFINNSFIDIFGGYSNIYYETLAKQFVNFASLGWVGMCLNQGWLFGLTTAASTGQRGAFVLDIRSANFASYSAAISPVIKLDDPVILNMVNLRELAWEETSSSVVYYRMSNFDSSDIDGPEWVEITVDSDLSTFATNGDDIQFQIRHTINGFLTPTAAKIEELLVSYTSKHEISEYWQGSVDNSTRNGESPAYSAFRLQNTYEFGSVPKLYFAAYDDDGNQIAGANTVDNPTFFDFSTNGGTSWTTVFGNTIPNVQNTEVRYRWGTSITQRLSVSIRES